LRLLHQALPHARLEIVKGLDHLAPEKAPATLAARIVAALSTPSVPTRPATPRP
jgi:pimeloyl-ACP methyl ester carboxylesterase